MWALRYRMRRNSTPECAPQQGAQLDTGRALDLLSRKATAVIVASDRGLFPVDSMQAEIQHLAQLATIVLNEHTNDHGLCAVCGCAFPCESAVLAEHNVALL